MVHFIVITVIVCAVLDGTLNVNGAHIIDVSDRLHYSLSNNWRQFYHQPTLKSLLGLPHDVTLQPGSSSVTVHGVHRLRNRELYKGIEVMDTSVEANVDENGRYAGGPVSGTIFLSLKEDLPDLDSCTLTEDEAKQKVFSSEKFPSNTEVQSEKYHQKVFVDSAKKAHHAYAVTILVRLPTMEEFRPHYVIDRCDGTILQKSHKMYTHAIEETWEPLLWDTGATESQFSPSPTTVPTSPTTEPTTTNTPTTTREPEPRSGCKYYVKGTGGNCKIGEIKYSESPYRYCLDVTVRGDMCALDNKFTKVVNLENGRDTSREDPIEFKCDEGFSDITNEAFNPSLDALFYGTAAFKVFEDWYGIYPLENKTKMMVHYGTAHENAYWNGHAMLFGDGRNRMYPLVSLDVVAHELSHGITNQNSDLIYSGQSGGMNEAFSDMSGELAENYVRGHNDWKMGFDIMKGAETSMRYFEDPTKDGRSIGHVSDFTRYMNVHFSSGIYNHVFYRIVELGGIPIRYAFEGFLIANQKYWTESTGFEAGACGTVRGAYDAGLDTEKYVEAFKAVGIKTCSITSFVEVLATSTPRTELRVSIIRRPLFNIQVHSDTETITVSAVSASGAEVKLELLKRFSTDNEDKTGTGSVEMEVEANAKYYVRAFTESGEEISDVTLTLELNKTD